MTHVDTSIARVRAAAANLGKKPLADRAGVGDTLLRGVESPDWNPTASTLRTFERVIRKGEDARPAAKGHGNQGTRNPPAAGAL